MLFSSVTHLLCGCGYDTLLQPIGLFLKVFPCFMVPVQITLNLGGKHRVTVTINQSDNDKQVIQFWFSDDCYRVFYTITILSHYYGIPAIPLARRPQFSQGWPSEPGRHRWWGWAWNEWWSSWWTQPEDIIIPQLVHIADQGKEAEAWLGIFTQKVYGMLV